MEFPQEFIEKLEKSESVLFFTGAGISAESGIPTFRGKDGLWKNYRAEELANFDAFLENPDRVWEWYQYRRKIIRDAAPNPGHLAIVAMENYFKEVVVVTQNIDNLHKRAGSKEVYELHGNIERSYCINCKTFYDTAQFKSENKVPRCPKCGGLIRPDVVWFGEMLPSDVLASAQKAAEQCNICFVVGTSAVVYPAAYIPITAKKSGAYLVEINIQPTELTPSVNLSLIGKAGEILQAILRQIVENK